MKPLTNPHPTVIILHGDDPFAIRQGLEKLVGEMGDPSLADMNISRLDGKQTSDDQLFSAANALPFMTERRLVILTTPFARVNSDATRKRFLALLDGLPESTQLVLVVQDVIDRSDWKSLPAKNQAQWMRKWITNNGAKAKYVLCQLPPVNRMPEWVREEARRMGGQFTQEAAAALVAHIGNDTQLASLEINKLLLYVDCKRAVEAEDVEELTAQAGQADVFAMVDALAAGNTRQALGMLHRLLETQEPLSLFGMITRQFRLLLQARELMDEGKGSHVAGEMHLPNFVADKLTNQARRFSMAQLEAIYHRLLAMDEEMKTGQIPADLALDTFVAGLAR